MVRGVQSVEILNSSEHGTPKYEATVDRLARRGVRDVLDHCDAMEAQGRDNVSIAWLRARLHDDR